MRADKSMCARACVAALVLGGCGASGDDAGEGGGVLPPTAAAPSASAGVSGSDDGTTGSGGTPQGAGGGTSVAPTAGGAASPGGSGGTAAAGAGGAAVAGMASPMPEGGSGAMSGAGPEPTLPSPSDPCPTLATGMVQIKGQNVQLWVGSKQPGKKGAIFFYWHGTGGSSNEASFGLGSAIQEITGEGGLVASFSTTTGTGANTGNNVWFTGDFEMADVIVKCAVEQLDIDTRRIYTGGCSAGGLQAGAMVYGRSSYLAAAMPNSGGVIFPGMLQDPAHVPAVITTHGGSTDQVFIQFSTTSKALYDDVVAKGGFAVNCDHGGDHCASPSAVKAAQWQFLKAHPFGVEPEPYAGGLPAGFPASCQIVQ